MHNKCIQSNENICGWIVSPLLMQKWGEALQFSLADLTSYSFIGPSSHFGFMVFMDDFLITAWRAFFMTAPANPHATQETANPNVFFSLSQELKSNHCL